MTSIDENQDNEIHPKISVVMATYNGEKYIKEQLDSIADQSLSADEVIIVDDCSTDNTVSIIKKYIHKNRMNNWRLYVNKDNIGWKQNFFNGAKKSTGEIIFFSDQDDVWLHDKLKIMVNAMIAYKMGCLYADKYVIDENGNRITTREEKKRYTGDIRKVFFSEAFYEIKTLGCCMCISRYVLNKYIEIGYYEGDHDSQCARIAVLYSTLWHVDIPVIEYRMHEKNTSGISKMCSYGSSTLEKRINELNSIHKWLKLLQQDEKLEIKRRQIIKNCNMAVRERIIYLSGKSHFFSLLKLKNYYSSITALVGDLAYKHNYIACFSADSNKEAFVSAPIIIGKNCWIGAHTVILRGTEIGDNCVVGAGCVLSGKYAPNSVIVHKRETTAKIID